MELAITFSILSSLLLIVVLIRLFTQGKESGTKELEKNMERLEKQLKDEMDRTRENLASQLGLFGKQLQEQMKLVSDLQDKNLKLSSDAQQKTLVNLQNTIENRLKLIQNDTNERLKTMQGIVDEKLQSTLEKRLTESFKQVTESFTHVQKGLGEMQELARGVGDLKKVLTNVKTRGTFGEVQLENIITEIFTPDQYEKNVATVPGSQDRVEFAIKLPGKKEIIYLPVDAKFPQEDYQRLLDAYEAADAQLVESARKDLEKRILAEAKDIKTKYVHVPQTTDFAIMFLPTEGLFAEVLRMGSLFERVRREFKIIIAGPTTFTAVINSLHMGFRTLAIEKRSAEVWTLLSNVKTEFGKFSELLVKTREKLVQATTTIDDAARKSRTIEKRLSDVQTLPGKPQEPEGLFEEAAGQ